MNDRAPALQAEKLDRAAAVLNALYNPARLRIVNLLEDGAWNSVQQIYTTLGLDPSQTSQHLTRLRRAGLVETQRAGKTVNYRIVRERYGAATGAISEFLEDAVGLTA